METTIGINMITARWPPLPVSYLAAGFSLHVRQQERDLEAVVRLVTEAPKIPPRPVKWRWSILNRRTEHGVESPAPHRRFAQWDPNIQVWAAMNVHWHQYERRVVEVCIIGVSSYTADLTPLNGSTQVIFNSIYFRIAGTLSDASEFPDIHMRNKFAGWRAQVSLL